MCGDLRKKTDMSGTVTVGGYKRRRADGGWRLQGNHHVAAHLVLRGRPLDAAQKDKDSTVVAAGWPDTEIMPWVPTSAYFLRYHLDLT